MKKQQEVVVVRKSSCSWWTVIKACLILAGLVFIAVKLYDKFVAKKQKAVELPEEPDANAEDGELSSEADDETGLCADAVDVIANSENMD